VQLSDVDRWILRNQYRILDKLDENAADECQRAISVLEGGYTQEYEGLVYLSDQMPEAQCAEVIEILEMHRHLRDGYDALENKDEVAEADITFHGFDGNHEPRELGYARFVINNEGRFQELAGSADDLNSHGPTLDRYRRMLPIWQQCVQERRPAVGVPLLTLEQIKRIVEAGHLRRGGHF
jgi:uncharacterized protein